MGKDPAILFYTSDFLNGVAELTMEERGQYITLLCHQHQHGRINTKRVGLFLGYDWDSLGFELKSKFIIDDDGYAYNERMLKESEKRANFIEKQRINGSMGGRPKKQQDNKKPKQNPNVNPNVNPNKTLSYIENENIIKDNSIIKEEGVIGGEENKFIPPTIEQVKKYFDEKGYTERTAEQFYNYYDATDWINKDGKPVANWKMTAVKVWFKEECKKNFKYVLPV
jgi:uncharacterized protein YdaU (DUF1376 family)